MTLEEIVEMAPIDALKQAAWAKADQYGGSFDSELAFEIRRWARQNLTPEQLVGSGL